MKKQVNNYQFENITSKMAKEFGTLKKGEEENYTFVLYPMEGNLLKLHRQNPQRTGRRAIEAVHICLLTVDGYINGIEYDFSDYLTEDNKDFVAGLLQSFDPFSHEGLMLVIKDNYDLKSPEDLREFYKVSIMCLLRIEKSIQTWTKRLGINGYFLFLENTIGKLVKHDDEMDFGIFVDEERGIFS